MTDQCNVGYGCGQACINREKQCRDGLASDSSQLADKVAELIKGTLNEDGTLKVSSKKNDRELTELEKTQLKTRADILDENKSQLIIAESKQMSLADDDIDQLWSQLPNKARSSIKSNGAAGTNNWWAPEGPTKNPSEDRGREIFKLWLEQGGRDAYTGGEEVLSLGDMDVEHIKPLSKGGLDEPDNWVLIRGGLNKTRNATDLQKFVASVDKKKKVSNGPKVDKADILNSTAGVLAKESNLKYEDYESGSGDYKKYFNQGLGIRNWGNSRINGRSGSDGVPGEIQKTVVRAIFDDPVKGAAQRDELKSNWDKIISGQIKVTDGLKTIEQNLKSMGSSDEAVAKSMADINSRIEKARTVNSKTHRMNFG